MAGARTERQRGTTLAADPLVIEKRATDAVTGFKIARIAPGFTPPAPPAMVSRTPLD